MKNSFFSRFTPKEPKFFPLLKQLSEILLSSSALLIEILGHDSPEKRAEDYKRIKDLEREGDKLTNLMALLSLLLLTGRISMTWLRAWMM